MNTQTPTQGTIEHVDPNTLTLEANVRPSSPLTKEFVASIRDHGVLTPVLARRDEQGGLIVRAGQRRTLAAREAGLSTIPAYIVAADDATVERIVQQMVENDQREALTDSDRAAAFHQLALEGLSIPTIAKRTSTKQAIVKNALAVADNPVAATAIQKHTLTLDQAAVLIEFEDDEEARAQLIDVAVSDPTQFAHAAQRARDEHRRTQLKTSAEAALAEQGYTVLDREPGYHDSDYTNIRDLITADGAKATLELIADTEGRAAYVTVYWTSDEATVSYYLADPKAAGFRKANNSSAASGPMTDEQKAERKTLIANNKAWASAEIVRREWLTEFLARKTPPKDANTVIAQGLTTHRRDVATAAERGNALAHELLGIERGSSWNGDKLAAYLESNPTTAQHVSLAVVLGGIESSTSKNTWRYPDVAKAAYFAQLADWGYSLSDVERIVIGSSIGSMEVDPEPATDRKW
ncbi:ParB/RepB/Spo0J family partition protein [Diaminobutyricibacter sp. McL0608]|uniref:ParB/RepB/Spo0J family partition protein n=1 Tax=Leifsonia sp. McL0608 TaxID=3143537 RepID=UPI0031F31BA7